jgi:hypothetical protein
MPYQLNLPRFGVLTLLAVLLVPPVSAQLRVQHGTIVTAGGSMRSESFSMLASAGQPAVDPTGTLRSGFVPSSEGITSVGSEDPESLPLKFQLHSNYPNPFNPTTNIHFDLPLAETVRIEVFDVLGRRMMVLADETLPAGQHALPLDASRLPSGIYLYRVQAGRSEAVGRMVLLK